VFPTTAPATLFEVNVAHDEARRSLPSSTSAGDLRYQLRPVCAADQFFWFAGGAWLTIVSRFLRGNPALCAATAIGLHAGKDLFHPCAALIGAPRC
jgi:hypothetical protein